MANDQRQILDLMNEGYADGFMASYYDGNGELIPIMDTWLEDGLARYLVAEASGLYDKNDSLEANKQRIAQALTNSIAEIEAVIRKLEE